MTLSKLPIGFNIFRLFDRTLAFLIQPDEALGPCHPDISLNKQVTDRIYKEAGVDPEDATRPHGLVFYTPVLLGNTLLQKAARFFLPKAFEAAVSRNNPQILQEEKLKGCSCPPAVENTFSKESYR